MAVGLSVMCLMLVLLLQAISFESIPQSTLSPGIVVCALEFAVQGADRVAHRSERQHDLSRLNEGQNECDQD